MRNITALFCLSLFLALWFPLNIVRCSDAAPEASEAPAAGPRGFGLVMANGTKIKISEYQIDPEKKTVFFKSALSGLAATFPLERIQRVVQYDMRLAEIPDDAMPLFIPEKTVQDYDDEGIPVLFKVQKTVVGSGGGSGSSSGYSRAGGSRSQDYRSSYRAGSSSSRTGSSVSGGRTTPGRTTGSSASSATESGSSAANNFFDALFGGKR
ncbi:MAG TPA: hypothetical protein PLV45_10075 [bacterium]|nr:hypothetical protein [bacterium]